METKLFKTIKWLSFSLYLLGTIIILGEAAIPSKQSAAQSNAVGNVIKDFIDGITDTKSELIKVKNIKIKENDEYNNKTIVEGTKFSLTAVIYPSNASNKSVIWESSNNDIVSINSNGEVYLKKAGHATISLISAENEAIFKTITISVSEAPITALEIINNNEEIFVGKTYNLTAKITPFVASYHPIEWSVEDSTILSITKQGTIKGLKEGKTIVKATSLEVTSSIEITVTKDPQADLPKIPLEALTLKNLSDNNEIILNKNLKLKYDIYPTNAYDVNVIWESSDDKVIKVKQDGTIYPVAVGSAKITIRSAVNKSIKSSIVLNVINIYPEKMSIISKLGTTVKVLKVNSSEKLDIKLEGDYTYDTISYSSSEPNVATIDNNGMIVCIKAGKTIIEASIGNNKISFELTIESPSYIKNQTHFLLLVRKGIGHFGAFFCLGLASIFMLLCFLKYLPSAFLLSAVQGFIIAGLSELIQAVTPGRFCTWNDVIIDFSGFICGVCGTIFIILLVKFIIWLIRTIKKERIYDPYALHPKRLSRKRK